MGFLLAEFELQFGKRPPLATLVGMSSPKFCTLKNRAFVILHQYHMDWALRIPMSKRIANEVSKDLLHPSRIVHPRN